MKKNQVGTTNQVTLRLERTLKGYVIILPLLVILYGLLIMFDYTVQPAVYSDTTFVMVALSLGLITLVQIVVKRPSVRLRALYMVLYHVILLAALVFVFGIFSPLIVAWLLLVIATMIFFGKSWAVLSFVGFIALITFHLAASGDYTFATLIQYALGVSLAGAVVIVFASLRSFELSEQVKLAASEAKQGEQRDALMTIINGTSQAIFTLSTTGIIRIYNAALLNLIDTNQSLSGRKVDDVLSLQDLSGAPISLMDLIKTSSSIDRDDLVIGFADGDSIRIHLNVNKVQSAFSSQRHNDSEGYVCIARDVTKEKSLDEERDEFISVVSHELRTPVAITEGTLSNVQFLLEQGTDAKKMGPALEEAHDQVVLLASMINDLGTLSRAERGVGDDKEEIDVRELVEGLYKKYSVSAEKKGLALNIDMSGRLGTITTSRLYLEELLQNFITNAIKYTQKGSVTIKVRRSAGVVEFAIKDTGIGISKTDLKHVFEKFYRSEDYRTRETSGTGLGLYVAQKLLHKLGTKVEVSSRLDHGSTFSFTLPANTSKPKA